MAYLISIFQLFGVLIILCVCSPLVSAADCKKDPPKVNPAKCCSMANIISQQLQDKCGSFMATTPSPASNSSPKPGKGPMGSSCFASCVFNQTGILSPDAKLVPANLTVYLKLAFANDTTMIPVVEAAFQTCATKKPTETEKPKTSATPTERVRPAQCPAFAGHLLGCVVRETILNCPANKWLSTDGDCNILKDYMKTCPPPK